MNLNANFTLQVSTHRRGLKNLQATKKKRCPSYNLELRNLSSRKIEERKRRTIRFWFISRFLMWSLQLKIRRKRPKSTMVITIITTNITPRNITTLHSRNSRQIRPRTVQCWILPAVHMGSSRRRRSSNKASSMNADQENELNYDKVDAYKCLRHLKIENKRKYIAVQLFANLYNYLYITD